MGLGFATAAHARVYRGRHGRRRCVRADRLLVAATHDRTLRAHRRNGIRSLDRTPPRFDLVLPTWVAAAGIDLDGAKFMLPIPQTVLLADGPGVQFEATATPAEAQALAQRGRAWVQEAGGRVHHEPEISS